MIVLGAGNFGTCIADHLAAIGNKVVIWARDGKVCESINSLHLHSKYLKGIQLNENLSATSNLDAKLFESRNVIMAIPTQSMRLQ